MMDATTTTQPRQPRRRRRRQRPQSEEDAAQTGAAEETLLALRLLGHGAGLRHPLHGHAYTRFTALRPRACHACEGAILGPFSKACHCLSCGLVVHRACVMRVPKAPCGSYRGLRDPDGRRSLPLEAQAATTAATEKDGKAQDGSPTPPVGPPSQAKQASVEDGDENGTQPQQRQQQQGIEAATAGTTEGAAARPPASSSLERRSMTYEALAMVGRLVGTMAGSSSSSSSASAPGAGGDGGSGSGSSSFGFATLRSGARAIAGAYAGYTVRFSVDSSSRTATDRSD